MRKATILVIVGLLPLLSYAKIEIYLPEISYVQSSHLLTEESKILKNKFFAIFIFALNDLENLHPYRSAPPPIGGPFKLAKDMPGVIVDWHWKNTTKEDIDIIGTFEREELTLEIVNNEMMESKTFKAFIEKEDEDDIWNSVISIKPLDNETD